MTSRITNSLTTILSFFFCPYMFLPKTINVIMLFLGYNLSKSEHFVFHTVLIVEPNSVHPLRYLATDPSHLSGRPLSPTNHPRPLGSRRPLASCRIAPMWHPSLRILFSSSRRWLPPMFLRRRLASHSLLFPFPYLIFQWYGVALPLLTCCQGGLKGVCHLALSP
jgi:hypothetical protein